MNRCILIGRLGNDVELRYTPSGTAVSKFTLATSRKVKGEQKTEWHRVVAWGKLAEICGKYLAKGKQVMIEGRIEYGSYDKDGVKHYTTDIIAENMEMLGGQGQRQEETGSAPASHDPDDVPF